MKKKGVLILLSVLLMLAAVGCGDREENGAEREVVLTGELVPTAEFVQISLPLEEFDDYVWSKDTVYYLQNEWLQEEGTLKSSLYRASVTGSEAPELIYENDVDTPPVIRFTMDAEGNMYWLERFYNDGNDNHYQIRKMDKDLEEQYCYTLDEKEFWLDDFSVYVCGMETDDNGNLIVWDISKNIYLLDADGHYLGKDEIKTMNTSKVVNAGEQGLYFWENDAAGDGKLTLQRVDFEKGVLGQMLHADLGNCLNGTENYTLLSGNGSGMLFSTDSRLYAYDLTTKETIELLVWADENVNIDGYDVEEIVFHSAQENAEPEQKMMVLIYDYRSSLYELAEITYIDKGYVQERETVILGTARSYGIDSWVKKFNRTNKEYRIEIQKYESLTEFTDILMYNPDEVPDVLDVSLSSADMLNRKNLLVDLEPYFKKSSVVNKKDIIDQIWEAGCYNKTLTSIMNGFSFMTCVTTADSISEKGWSYDDFFDLEEAYQESRPLETYTAMSVWNMLTTTCIDDYIDWNNGTCDFESGDFKELLIRLKEADYVTTDFTGLESEQVNQFLAGDYLVKRDSYSAPYDYKKLQNQYAGKVKNVGYPTGNGSACYLISPQMQLGIYSQSDNKDGAWAFIEYLLSEEGQDWYGEEYHAFPVREDAFDTYLSRSYARTRNYEYDEPDETAEKEIRKMLKYAKPAQDGNAGKITIIINEELQAYLDNAKTAEQTAAIIQSRVQMYLDETF